MMPEWLLTDEEIERIEIIHEHYWELDISDLRTIARAQSKKLAGWLEQYIEEVYPLDQTANEILQVLRKELWA